MNIETGQTSTEPVLQPMMDWAQRATNELREDSLLRLDDEASMQECQQLLDHIAAVIRSSLTDVDVGQWVKERQAEMDDKEVSLSVYLSQFDGKPRFLFSEGRLRGSIASADSLEAAKKEYWKYVKTPQERAKQKRDEAQRLILEAAQLDAQDDGEPEHDEVPATHALESAALKEAKDIEKYGMPEPWEERP